MEKTKNPHTKPRHYVIFCCCILATFFVSRQFIIVQGHSMNVSLALVLPVDIVTLKKGDIATFLYRHEMFENNNEEVLLVKRVACAPKSYLEKMGASFFCDGIFIGEAKIARTNGDLFPVFTYKGVIPENNYFLLGDYLGSFDSRYLGFIKKENLKHFCFRLF